MENRYGSFKQGFLFPDFHGIDGSQESFALAFGSKSFIKQSDFSTKLNIDTNLTTYLDFQTTIHLILVIHPLALSVLSPQYLNLF